MDLKQTLDLSIKNGLSNNEGIILSIISDYTNTASVCYERIIDIAHICNMSESTCKRAISVLIKMELIERVSNGLVLKSVA